MEAKKASKGPGTLVEFSERFPDEAACMEYLRKTRWPKGFVTREGAICRQGVLVKEPLVWRPL
jgi:hypothetical protein